MNEATYMSNWTVMVYFAADNDLDDVAFENLRQMKQAGSNSKFNILAQLDTRGIGQTIRFRIRDQRTTLDEDTLSVRDEINTGLGSELTNFVKWGMKQCPAEHYMLIIWGHGNGLQSASDAHRAAALTTDAVLRLDDENSLAISAKGEIRVFVQRFVQRQVSNGAAAPTQISISPEIVSAITGLRKKERGGGNEMLAGFTSQLNNLGVKLDDDRIPSQDVLTNAELRKALEEALGDKPGGKLDILGMDACLMGMAETAYEVRKSVEYFIASEDAVPRASWPYDRMLSRLAADPAMSPKEVALIVIREYLIHYRGNNKGVTLSACHLSEGAWRGLRDAVTGLVLTLKEKLDDDKVRLAILAARATAQAFYLREFVDLHDFCKQLVRFSTDADVKKRAGGVMKAIFPNQGKGEKSFSEDTFVWTYGYCDYPLKDAKGVSIYFPLDRLPGDEYKDLEFTAQTGWAEFVESFINKLGLPGIGSPVKDKVGEFISSKNLKIVSGTDEKVASGTDEKVASGTDEKVASGTDEKVASGTDEKIPLGSLTELPSKQQNSPQFEHEQEKEAAEKRA
ncbi:MAG: clostripain-related cysteine peptidase [Acidobacteriota bacterium]|nr:clostripain-related cysteine peptidase [Acidobacteriota bacterium]